MVLTTALCLKIFLSILAGTFLCWKFKNTISRKSLAGLALVCFIGAYFANAAAAQIPPLTDQVVLTALGQTGEGGKGQEVYLEGFTVDGRKIAPENAAEGKWFWLGDRYCWRPETDQRQPEGTTRSVVLKVPVGWTRTVHFSGGEYRGYVQIDGLHDTHTIDTSVTSDAVLGRSETQVLIKNQIMYLAAFACLLAVFTCIEATVVQRRKIIKTILIRHWSTAFYIVLSLLMLLFMVLISEMQSFWGDELHQIAFIREGQSFREILDYHISNNAGTPPLYALILAIWYRIAPYGQRWLLLPSEIFAAACVWGLGALGEQIAGKRAGIIAAVLAAASSALVCSGGLELRTYSLFALFSVLILLLFFIRIKNAGRSSCQQKVLYTAVLIGVLYSHYLAIAFCGTIFAVDGLLFLTKRLRFKELIPYFIAGVAYLPWFCTLLVMKLSGKMMLTTYRAQQPKIEGIQTTVNYLLDNNTFLIWFLFAGMAVSIAYTIQCWSRRKATSFDLTAAGLLTFIILFFYFGMYTFGVIAQRDFIVYRYFICMLPCMLLLVSLMITRISYYFVGKNIGETAVTAGLAVFCALTVGISSVTLTVGTQRKINHPAKEAAQWLMTQNDIYAPDTVVVITGRVPMNYGWEYYLTENGKRDPINVMSSYALSHLEKYKTIYVFQVYGSPDSIVKNLPQEQVALVEKAVNNKLYKYIVK